jgi:hypothetical protein
VNNEPMASCMAHPLLLLRVERLLGIVMGDT